jgi:hypothetical protein
MSFERQGSPEPISHKGAFVLDDAIRVNCGCGRLLGHLSHNVFREADSDHMHLSGKIVELDCTCGQRLIWDGTKTGISLAQGEKK